MEFKINNTVYHPIFGKGIILEIYYNNCGEVAKTKFENHEDTKELLTKYARLSKSPIIIEEKLKQEPFKINKFEPTETNSEGTLFSDYIKQGASNRHLEARKNFNKLTAGEAAKKLSKILKRKILSKDVIPHLTECHHAGLFYNKFTKRMSGKKVYFVQKEDLPKLIEKLKVMA